MSEPGLRRRLHPSSALFIGARMLRHLAPPLLALLIFGNHGERWHLWVIAALLPTTLWALLRAYRYRYELQGELLLIHEGLIGREWRQIPFARIHTTSQRRQLLHRLLGVTELSLESAAGGKPEAVMRVLSLPAAAELEARVRESRALPERPHPSAGAGAPVATAEPEVWLQLRWPELVRLGLISNRGMVVVGALMASIMPKQELREPLLRYLRVPLNMVRQQLGAAERGPLVYALELLALVLLGLLLLRLLSVVLALFHYHGFRLTQQGEKLRIQRGLSTQISASARLPRLQRWELSETWLHRCFARQRLAVSAAGDGQEEAHGLEPGRRFEELAPIATPDQAQALLRRSLPQLDWERLVWRPLSARAGLRRSLGVLRWTLLVLLVGALLSVQSGVGEVWLWAALTPLALLTIWVYAQAWARFAAVAEQGELLLFREGVLNRRWLVVAAPRLQQISLFSSALDRQFGLVHLRADTQGGARHRRALDIPCLERAEAERLRAWLWQQMQRPY